MAETRRWHTPTPAYVPPAEPASLLTDALKQSLTPLKKLPPGNWGPRLETLARILQRNRWNQNEQLDDLQVLQRYDREYPGTLKDDELRHPEKHVYRLVVQLMAPLEVADTLDDLVRQGADTSPFPRGSKDFFAGSTTKPMVPCPEHPCGVEHDARDHMLPNNMVLHRHRFWSAYNKGPRVGNDPYLGTGLDPAHTWGVVAPADGCEPEMACCGQPVKSLVALEQGEPPGCWIVMDPSYNSVGELKPYRLWYDMLPGETLWTDMMDANPVQRFTQLTRIGTAFLDEAYYRDLHARIQTLTQLVLPAVIRVMRDFPQIMQSAHARLSDDEKKALYDLVSLVELYNAPQNGACAHARSLTAADFDREVFHLSEGRKAFYGGRLRTNIRIREVSVPLVLSTPLDRAFRATAVALRTAGAESAAAALESAARLFADETNAQLELERARVNRERVVGQPFSVQLPSALGQRWQNNRSLYDAARDVADRLRRLLDALPSEVNAWILNNEGDNVPLASPLLGKIDAARGALTQTLRQVRELEVDTQDLGAELDRYRRVQETARRAAAEEEARRQAALAKAEEERRQAAAEVAARQEERVFDLPNDARNKAFTMAPIVAVPAAPAPIVRGTNYRYEANSCPYDSFFAALFKVPNQWFREQVRSAARARIPSKPLQPGEAACTPVDVLRLHNTLVEGIQFVEDGTQPPQVCPLPRVWETCMATRRPGAGIQDDPVVLLNALVSFYQVEFGVYTHLQDLPATEIPSGRELVIVQPRLPAQLREGQSYDVPLRLKDGEYELLSCFIYTDEPGAQHFDALVRDPRTLRWTVYRTSGVPLQSQQPASDPAVEAVQRTKRDPAAAYSFYPTAWIYVRTMRLAPFVVDSETAGDVSAVLRNREAALQRFLSATSLSYFGVASLYSRFWDLLSVLHRKIADDVRDNTLMRFVDMKYYAETVPNQEVVQEFSLPAFVILFLLGRTGIVSDPSVMSSDLADIATNVEKFGLPWEAARAALGPLLVRLKYMEGDARGNPLWATLRPLDRTQMTRTWDVDSGDLRDIWFNIGKLLRFATQPDSFSAADVASFTTTYKEVWDIIKTE